MKKIAILGSTGSIGTQSLEVIRSQPDMEATVLAAGSNVELLEKQIREFHPKLVCVYKEDAAKLLKQAVADLDVTIVSGMDGLNGRSSSKKDAKKQAAYDMLTFVLEEE